MEVHEEPYASCFFFFLSMCSVQCHFMNIALDHQMKALRNEKKKNSELKVRKDGFKKVMEDICFLTKSQKKIVKVTRILPGKKKKKRACKLNTSSFFLSHIFTNVLKLLTSLKKTSMYNYLQRKNGLKNSLKIYRGVFYPQPPREGKKVHANET